MEEFNQDKFSARAPALGYLYQCRYALLESLSKISDSSNFNLSIETLDDIVFESENNALELLQTKHSVNKFCNLTDASTDLWKTLRIWIERLHSNEINEDSFCYLITTNKAGENSAASYLRIDASRDIDKALSLLKATATTSSNQDNSEAYKLFNQLCDKDKILLLNIIHIIDNSPSIDPIEEKIKKTIHYAVDSTLLINSPIGLKDGGLIE